METTAQALDIAWILVCAALVMLMQAGFSCLESGLVRTKNSINVAAKNFADFCLSSVIFWVFGFGLMFGSTISGIFGTSGFFFGETASPWLLAFFIFQLGFCGTATTIVSGAVSERMRFSGYLVVATIISGLIYPLIGHWVWGSAAGSTPGGWLEQMGFIDFAGSTVVHSVGGWVSLAAIIIIGPRIGRFGEDAVPIHGHDLPFVTLGVFLLWFGWFGFNGGSTLGLTPDVPKIIVNTTISGAFGGMAALALSWRLDNRPDVTMIMNGSLAGLVGITASANIMTPLAAVGIGSISAMFMYVVTLLLERFEIDDVVGAVPVHLAAGIWGTLAVAIFANPQSWGSELGRWDQFIVQATGVGATFVWAFGLGFALLWLVNRWFPLRIDPDGEKVGLNVAEHGASTEILDLLTEMDTQRSTSDYSKPVNVEPHTEIGQIAQQYNRVLTAINDEHSKLKATSKTLKQKSKSLELLRETAAAANQAKSFEDAVQTCLDGICAFGGWSIGHCLMVKDGEKVLTSARIWRIDDEERYAAFREASEKIKIDPGGCLSGRVLASGKSKWFVEVSKEKNFFRAREAREAGIRGAAAFPVLVGKEVAAVIEFFSPEPLELNETVLEVMSSVGSLLGRVVERARSAEARFKTMVDNMPASVHLRDKDGRFILVNRQYEEFYGVANDGIRGKTLMEANGNPAFHQISEQSAAGDREVIENNTVKEYEHRVTSDDGFRSVTDRLFPITGSSGEVIEVGGVEIDITDLKRTEEALQDAYGIIKDQKERMEEELNIGRDIQMSMVPLNFPPFPDHDEFSIFAALKPAREVGGDFYDFYFLDEERLCICIGDVSGKGVPAALFMAMAKTLIKSRADDDHSTASILTHTNDELSTDNASSMFVTIFIAIINIKTGQLLFTNAGHDPPFIKRSDGTLRKLDQRHGPVVGAIEGMAYKEDMDIMAPGDLLIIFTDGVTEAMDIEGQLFSVARYAEILSRTDANNPDSIVGNTLVAIENFTSGAEQSDDITILALKFHGASEGRLMAEQQIVIKNELSELIAVNEKFENFSQESDIPQEVSLKFNIIFDEILSNVISYAYNDDDEHDIEIRMERAGKRVTVTITDDGVPFNPLSEKKPNTDLSLEDREIGGLGIHLVRNLVDDVSYQRRIGKNVMTMMRNLELNDETP